MVALVFADISIQLKVQAFFLELLADCRISDNDNLNIRAAWKLISGYTHDTRHDLIVSYLFIVQFLCIMKKWKDFFFYLDEV